MPASQTIHRPAPELASAAQIAALIDIALRSLDADAALEQRKAHDAELKSAYVYHKAVHQLDHVDRDTPEWAAMMAATSTEYQDAEKAKRAEYNARRRLQTAIRSYRSA